MWCDTRQIMSSFELIVTLKLLLFMVVMTTTMMTMATTKTTMKMIMMWGYASSEGFILHLQKANCTRDGNSAVTSDLTLCFLMLPKPTLSHLVLNLTLSQIILPNITLCTLC